MNGEEMADRALDAQIDDYQEEQWQRAHAAHWPTSFEHDSHLDTLEPPPPEEEP